MNIPVRGAVREIAASYQIPLNFLDRCDTITMRHEVHIFFRSVRFYIGKNAGSIFAYSLEKMGNFVSQQWELCVFQVRSDRCAPFYI